MTASPCSFDELVERYRPELLAYLRRLLGNIHDAEDVCQDAFLRAYRAVDRLEANSNLRAWLYKVATNTVLGRGGGGQPDEPYPGCPFAVERLGRPRHPEGGPDGLALLGRLDPKLSTDLSYITGQPLPDGFAATRQSRFHRA